VPSSISSQIPSSQMRGFFFLVLH